MSRPATPEEKAAAEQMEAALQNEQNNEPEKLLLNDEPEKRKAGRPKGSKSGSRTEELLLNAIGGDDAPKASGNKPGRKPGVKKAMDPAAIGNQLVGIHQLVAMFTGLPEMVITPEEGKGLGEAVVNVCAEYNLNVDGKTGAAIQLFAACAMIYAPRVLQIRYRIAMEKAQHDNAATAPH